MAPLVHSVEIDRSPEDVFACVTDPIRFPEWQDAVVRAGPKGSGPLQQGSKIELTRRMGKLEQTMTNELTEYSPPRSYAFRVLDGLVRALSRPGPRVLGRLEDDQLAAYLHPPASLERFQYYDRSRRLAMALPAPKPDR